MRTDPRQLAENPRPTGRAVGAADDEVLLRRFAGGDAHAARVLAARHLPRLLSLGRRMLGDPAEAEDVAQEAMLRLWRQAPRWRAGDAQVSTWLYRVASNLCIDRLRRTDRTVAADPDAVPEVADDRPGPEAALTEKARLRVLDAALAALPDRQRQAVVLRHIEGLSNPEIAEIMEISVEAVESLTARGKRALARALAARKEELGYDG
ncbi:MAG: RNA polymerase sigma factor [Alphaproteobacteria bacterium]|nr:MAG: RNA polymerase sigma factor [Alphaproteobacteria bacterium]